MCFQRAAGSDAPVPGCGIDGSVGVSGADYCAPADKVAAYDALLSPEGLLPVANHGSSAHNTEHFPLTRCEGDCDQDSHCAADLVCVQRDNSDPLPFGCTGTAYGNYDYCGINWDSADVTAIFDGIEQHAASSPSPDSHSTSYSYDYATATPAL